ncbi:MAG: GTPase RsgA, partial [Colwellia sp.]|uniref:GTPase RsgA n=1 Tax=Colwellia sp. TaxID=56799 RepID=UPI001DEC4666|nr:GTPase RsgA [Colwellia sp.]
MQRCSRQASTSSSIRSNDAGAYTQRIRAKGIAAIREDDSKGRYTTTFRSLKILPQGGLLMDTPG